MCVWFFVFNAEMKFLVRLRVLLAIQIEIFEFSTLSKNGNRPDSGPTVPARWYDNNTAVEIKLKKKKIEYQPKEIVKHE